MKLKTKLSLGIGFLFVIIYSLVIFCMYYINTISSDSENILKDNYNSVQYAKNMFISLDDMNMSLVNHITNPLDNIQQTQENSFNFQSAKKIFDMNLSKEKNNITESNEKGLVQKLLRSYDGFIKTSNYLKKVNNKNDVRYTELAKHYEDMRESIESISDINMQAIIDKNQFARKDEANMKMLMGVVGTISVLLAFAYFWYYPFYVSHTIEILAAKMTDLLKKAGIEHDLKTKDESIIMLKSIQSIDENLDLIKKVK